MFSRIFRALPARPPPCLFVRGFSTGHKKRRKRAVSEIQLKLSPIVYGSLKKKEREEERERKNERERDGEERRMKRRAFSSRFLILITVRLPLLSFARLHRIRTTVSRQKLALVMESGLR